MIVQQKRQLLRQLGKCVTTFRIVLSDGFWDGEKRLKLAYKLATGIVVRLRNLQYNNKTPSSGRLVVCRWDRDQQMQGSPGRRSRCAVEYPDRRRCVQSTRTRRCQTRRRRWFDRTTSRSSTRGSSSKGIRRYPSVTFHCRDEKWNEMKVLRFTAQEAILTVCDAYVFLGIFAANPKSPTTASITPSLDFLTRTFCKTERERVLGKTV